MEKLPNFVINGGVKMPVGYRFHPTDEELVVHYLKRKVHASPLPASIIPEFDVFHTHPWGLPGDVREKRRYFFYNHQLNINVNNEIDSKLGKTIAKSKRAAAGCGYWKPIGKVKQIVSSETNQAVGVRKTLVFCQRKHPNYHGTKTRWLMHEYSLLASDQTNPTHQESKREMGNWVVCRVFQKRRKPQRSDIGVVSQPSNSRRTRTDPRTDHAENNTFMSSAGLSSCPFTPCFSSCYSDITELSPNANGGLDNDDDQEENSSANINQ